MFERVSGETRQLRRDLVSADTCRDTIPAGLVGDGLEPVSAGLVHGHDRDTGQDGGGGIGHRSAQDGFLRVPDPG